MKITLIISKFLILNLQKLHSGVGFDKMVAAGKISAVPAIVVSSAEGLTKWYLINQTFMIFVFIAIILDHILGTIVHAFIKRDFVFKKNVAGFLLKGGACIAGYSLFVMIHEILKDVPFIADYFQILIQFMVFIYPAGSAMGNLSIITGGKFPPIGWMKKLEKFQENVDITEFNTKQNENTDNNP